MNYFNTLVWPTQFPLQLSGALPWTAGSDSKDLLETAGYFPASR
jgi:hypothetical protein